MNLSEKRAVLPIQFFLLTCLDNVREKEKPYGEHDVTPDMTNILYDPDVWKWIESIL